MGLRRGGCGVPLRWDRDADYAYLDKGVGLHDWAWEFLRRNPAYQAAYQRADQDDGEHMQPFIDATHAWGLNRLCDPSKTFAQVDLEGAWEERIGPILQTPVAELSARRLPARRKGMLYLIGYRGGETIWTGYPERATFSFDLRLPVEPQIAEVREELRWCQAEAVRSGEIKVKKIPAGKVHADHYRRYVRLLDGKAGGADWTALGAAIFPRPQYRNPADSAMKAWKPAQRLAESGYRSLLLRPNQPTVVKRKRKRG